MKKPDIPVNEKERLTSLRSLNILDSEPEERYDRLTRLATKLFNVPIALVSLVDEDRQWFKSNIGLKVNETPRDISFCGHSIQDNEVLVINDTLLDERFSDNPLVTDDPNIRFYAGCPLRHINGSLLGTLCIIDTQPRSLKEEDITALIDLAELTEHEIAAAQLATVDELTKIANRRGFINLAKKGLAIGARQNLAVSLLFFDLNDFKNINDNFGHDEGDLALKSFALLLQNAFRASDLIARLGGDEFVVLLVGAKESDIQNICRKFDQALDNYNQNENRGYDICYSLGYESIDKVENTDIEALLKNADEKMYLHKNNK